MVTVEDVISRLDSRAANHGVSPDVLLEMIPSNVGKMRTSKVIQAIE